MRLTGFRSGCRWRLPLLCDTAQRHRLWQWTWDGPSVTEHMAWEPETRSASAPGGRRAGSGPWSWPAGLRAQSPGPSGVFPALTLLQSLRTGRSRLHSLAPTVCGMAVPRPGRIPGTGHAGHPASLTWLLEWTTEGKAAARRRPCGSVRKQPPRHAGPRGSQPPPPLLSPPKHPSLVPDPTVFLPLGDFAP